MSIKVMTHIWEHSQQKGSALLLLLAIADHAHDDGTGAYPSVESLATKSRMTPRNVQYVLRNLAASSELSIEPGAGPKGANLYTIPLNLSGGVKTFQGEAHGSRGEIQGIEGVKPLSPKPSGNHQRTVILPLTIGEDFRKEMQERFGATLNVDEIIEEALAHVNSKKWTDKQAYVRGWLRREANHYGNNGGPNGKSRSNHAQDSGRPLTVYTIPEGQPLLGSKPKTML